MFNIVSQPKLHDSIQKEEIHTYYSYVKVLENHDIVEITVN